MPIFEYVCERCNADFEQLVRSSRAKVKCPQCSCRKVRRKFSVFAVSGSSKSSGPASSGSSCTSCHATSCAGCRK